MRYLLITCLALSALFSLRLGATTLHQVELENGFRIVVQHAPARTLGDRVAMRLVLDVGSANEGAGERGWAHLIEHMAFLGAGRFSRADIDALYDQPALRHGRDFNAYTSAQHTVYTASVPRDRTDVVDATLELMRAWLEDMHFDPDAIAIEAGVVRAELLSGDSAVQRQADAAWHALIDLSTPAHSHAPGGDLDLPSRDALKAFWSTHYDVARATLVVAGDVDTNDISQRAAGVFAGLVAKTQRHSPGPAADAEPVPAAPRVLVQYNPSLDEPQLSFGLLPRPGLALEPESILAVEALLQWWRQSEAVQAHCGPVFRERLRLKGGQFGYFFISAPGQTGLATCLESLEQHFSQQVAAMDAPAWRALQRGMVAELRGARSYAPPSSADHLADELVRRVMTGASTLAQGDRIAAAMALVESLDATQAAGAIVKGLSDFHAVVAYEMGQDGTTSSMQTQRLEQFAARMLGTLEIENTPARTLTATSTSIPDLAHDYPHRAATIAQESRHASGARTLKLASGVVVHHLPGAHADDPIAMMVINRNNLLDTTPVLSSAARSLPALFELLGEAYHADMLELEQARAVGIGASLFVESTRQGMVLESAQSSIDDAFALLG
ncbi:MAG: insulinase family protein, partial [Pseudomonadota bacterium]